MFEVKLFISFFMVVGNAKDKFFVLLVSLQPFLHGDNLINILPLNSMLHEVDALFIVSEFAFRGEGVEEYKECVDGTFLSLSEILEFIVGLLFSSVVFEDSNELGPQLIQTKPIFHVFLDPLINNLLGQWSCTSSSHVCQDSKGANFVIGELHSMNGKVDFNSHYPFIELRGISIINSWFGNKDNLSCVRGRDGGHSSGR